MRATLKSKRRTYHSLSVTASGYGAVCVGSTFVACFVNSNRNIQSLRTVRSPTLGGANFQACAASKARRAKYLLGPGESNSASVTVPEESRLTLTLTLTVP